MTEAKPKVGLLLNGGGAKGIVQAGAIKALVDFGIEYDAIYGASVGSLNGAMLHQGDLDAMEKLWMDVRSKDVWRWSLLDVLKPFGDYGAVYDSQPLYRMLLRLCDPAKMYRNPVPFYVGATSFDSWSPVMHNVHDLAPQEIPLALYASASPPVFFPPVRLRGDTLVDAGVLNNYNISYAVKDGMDVLIIIGFAVPEPSRPKNAAEVLTQTLSVAMYGYYHRELKTVEKVNELLRHCPVEGHREIKVVKIVPEKSTGISLLDFDYKQDRKELFKQGYDLAARVLEKEYAN